MLVELLAEVFELDLPFSGKCIQIGVQLFRVSRHFHVEPLDVRVNSVLDILAVVLEMCLNSVTVQFLLAAHFTLRFVKYFPLLVYVLVEVITDNVRNFLIAEYLCHDVLLALGDELLKLPLELGVFYLSDLLRSFVNSLL